MMMLVRALIAVLVILLAIASGNPLWHGAVVVLDDDYEPQWLAASGPTLGAPDGLFHDGRHLWIADETAGTIGRLMDDGTVQRCFEPGSGPQSPEDLVVAANGNVYFTDDDAGGVWQWSESGGLQCLVGPEQGLTSTEGIALLADGSLLVGDGQQRQLFRVWPDGTSSVWTLPVAIDKPESLAVDPDGNLYVADDTTCRVWRISREGQVQRLLDSADGLIAPETICYRDGTLYITDNESHTLYRYRPTEGLQPIAAFGGRLKNVQGLAVDSKGNLYVSVQTHLGRQEGYLLRFALRRSSASPDALPLVESGSRRIPRLVTGW